MTKYENGYSDNRFWKKLSNYAKVAGLEVVEKALQLFYAAQGPDTPIWAKTVIYGALGYFIVPVDAIPDVTPVVGYGDDLGVLAAAVGTVAMHIDKKVKRKAKQKLNEWFED